MVDVLHVFAPMGKARKTGYVETFVGQNDTHRHELVGVIDGYPVDGEGLAMAKRDFPSAEATFVTRRVHHCDGMVGVAIYLGLWVDSMAAAQALDGFSPLFDYTGGFSVPSLGSIFKGENEDAHEEA